MLFLHLCIGTFYLKIAVLFSLHE